MTCEHHWNDEGIWEYCCECNAHKCEAIQRVRKLAEKLQKKEAFHQLTAYACAEEILKALDGER